MDPLTITLLVLAVLALGGFGYGYYAARPVGPAYEPVAAPSPGLAMLGIVGLMLLVAFIVLLATGWRFGLDVQPPP